jgi:hypothetical protein
MTDLAITQEFVPIFPSESAFVVPFRVSRSRPPLRIITVVKNAEHVVDILESHAGKSNANCCAMSGQNVRARWALVYKLFQCVGDRRLALASVPRVWQCVDLPLGLDERALGSVLARSG